MVIRHGKFGIFWLAVPIRNVKIPKVSVPMEWEGHRCFRVLKKTVQEKLWRNSPNGEKSFTDAIVTRLHICHLDKPVPKQCPLCGASFLIEKSTKKEGVF